MVATALHPQFRLFVLPTDRQQEVIDKISARVVLQKRKKQQEEAKLAQAAASSQSTINPTPSGASCPRESNGIRFDAHLTAGLISQGDPLDEDFFCVYDQQCEDLAAKTPKTVATDCHKETIEAYLRKPRSKPPKKGEEVLDKDWWKKALAEIPECLREVYLIANTPMPSSAGAERLFSLAGRVFSPTRSRLQDGNFEALVFLRSNWDFLKSSKVNKL